ncbi:HTH-type transcriptional regulator CueR [compost metagenome]
MRFYERQGLLDEAPQPGLTNNYKEYSAQALRRIELIGHAKALGFTLKEIADVIAVWQENALDAQTKRAMLETKIAQIDDKARSMAVLRAGLIDALAKVETGCNDVAPVEYKNKYKDNQ